MPDDSSYDDDTCPTCEAFRNPIVQNAIEQTVDAFFEAIGNKQLEAGDGMTAAAAAVASIADAIYIGIKEAGHGDDVSAPEFRTEFLEMVDEYLETLMSVDAEDDAEVNEPYPQNVTTH